MAAESVDVRLARLEGSSAQVSAPLGARAARAVGLRVGFFPAEDGHSRGHHKPRDAVLRPPPIGNLDVGADGPPLQYGRGARLPDLAGGGGPPAPALPGGR